MAVGFQFPKVSKVFGNGPRPDGGVEILNLSPRREYSFPNSLL